jgi:hypothetical protein
MMTYYREIFANPSGVTGTPSSVTKRTVFLLTKKGDMRICPQPFHVKKMSKDLSEVKKRQEVRAGDCND